MRCSRIIGLLSLGLILFPTYNPVCYPYFRSSASVMVQKAAFATDLPSHIYRFYPSLQNSASASIFKIFNKIFKRKRENICWPSYPKACSKTACKNMMITWATSLCFPFCMTFGSCMPCYNCLHKFTSVDCSCKPKGATGCGRPSCSTD